MNKRSVARSFSFLVIFSLLLSALGLPVMHAQATTITFTAEEFLGKPTDTSVTINIVPASAIEYSYEYGTTQGGPYPNATTPITAIAVQPSELTISGLSPNTHYFYRMIYDGDGDVNDGDYETRTEHSFWTQRAPGSSFTFTVTSDSHGTAGANAMTNITNEHPDFEIDLGDTFYVDGSGSQDAVNAKYLAYRAQSSFGKFGSSVPLFLSSGNHENEEGWNFDDTPFSMALGSVLARKLYYPTPIEDGFYSGNTDILAAINAATYGDQFREDYYAWTWGDALFVVIDPFQYTMTLPYTGGPGEPTTGETLNTDQWGWTLGSQQYQWFKQTLQNSSARYKFVFSHQVVGGITRPIASVGAGYVRGGAENLANFEWGDVAGFATHRDPDDFGTTPIHQLMVANGVSAYFHGHDHQYVYEKTDDGVVYQEVPSTSMTASGFTGIYTTGDHGTYETIKMLASPGHLRITITPDLATVDYISASSTAGTVNYFYTIAPNSTGPKHDLTTAVSPSAGGTINPSAGTHSYSQGSLVTVTASPASGYAFDHWEGDCSGTGTCQVTMDADKSVTAIFTTLPTYTLTANNDGHGTVTLNPTGGTYASGTTVTLTPAPSSGYVFGYWSGANAANIINTAGIYTIVMNGNKTVQANFTQITYTLTAGNDGHGTVTLNPTGGTYASGTTVTLTPNPSTGYVFGSWSGANAANIINTSGIYTIVMDGNKTVQANFTQVTYTLTANNDGHGTVTLNPTGGTYASGTTVTLTPNPSTGYVFGSWSGANAANIINTSGVYTIVLNGNKTVQANFTQITYTLTAGNDGQGTVTLNPTGGVYASGTTVTLTPVPNSGYQFSSWTGANAANIINTSGVYTIVMNGNKTVQANFTQVTYTLTAGNDGHGTVTLNPTGGVYASGTTVTLTPVPASGYQFGSWSGANAANIINTSGVYTIVMNGNKTVQANFTQVTYTLTAGNDGHGTVTLNPTGGVYASGTTVTLTPVPNSGYQFGSWSGANAANIINTSGVYTIVMNGDKTVQANFTQITYTLTANNDGHGTVTLNPTGGVYASGTTVTLTPAPSSGYVFGSWSGANAADVINISGVYTIVMNGNKTVQANFTQITYTLTAGNDGHGTVTLNPTGGTYASGTTVTLTPAPSSGYVFGSWSGANAGDVINTSGIYTIVMNGNKTVQANFTQITYTLTAGNDGHGTVTLNPTGGTYASGTTVTLTPNPSTGYVFGSWTGANAANIINTSGVYTIVMNGNKTVQANFTQITYTLTAGNDGHGTVTLNPTGGVYASGTTVTLTPAPSSGYVFGSWSGANAADVINTSGVYTIVMNGNKTVQANFTQITYTLTANNDGHGTVTLNPAGGTYASGTTVTLTPVPNSGYQFGSWSGANAANIINTSGVYTIVMNGNKTVQANFTQITYTLTAGNDGHGTVTLNPTGGTYASGTTITLTPNPSTGYFFGSWSGANAANIINTSGVYTIVMNGNKTVQANFTQITYTLTAGNDGHGTVTLNPTGGTYASGTTITLTPNPSTGYFFGSWSGANAANIINTSGVYTIVMNGNKTVQANFTQITYTLAANNDGHGTVTLNPTGGVYASGTTVTLTPVPNSGYQFGSWSGANAANIINTSGVYTIVMNGNKTVQSNFSLAAVTHTLPLVSGWNLVSFNVHPTSTSVASVLGSVTGNFDLVYAWNSSTSQWLKSDNIPLTTDTLTSLDESMGFWIHMTAADTLELSGTAPVSTNIALNNGWNLVGYPSRTNLALPAALTGHGVSDLLLVYAYHANDTGDPWKKYDPAAPLGNDLDELAPAWGCWIRLSAPHTWDVTY